MTDQDGPNSERPLTGRDQVRYGLGAASIFAAFLIVTAIVLDALFTLPLSMPATFYTNRALWMGLVVVLVSAGWILQAPLRPVTRSWSPSIPGRRFRQLKVFGRNGCHLCDEAVDLLEKYRQWLPPLELVNIDEDSQLVARFGEQIPVVECDGRVRFRGRVSEILLRRLLEGTRPALTELGVNEQGDRVV